MKSSKQEMENLSKMRSLCGILGVDMMHKVQEEVDTSVSDLDAWMSRGLNEGKSKLLNSCVERLSQMKSERYNEVKRMGNSIISFWDILSTPLAEKEEFLTLTYYLDVKSENEIQEINALALSFVNKVVGEFSRLEKQVRDLVVKKKSKLDQVLKSTYMTSAMYDDIGMSEPLVALDKVTSQIKAAKAAASERKDVINRFELLQSASKERESGIWHLAVRATELLERKIW